jgi:hypothetical protein
MDDDETALYQLIQAAAGHDIESAKQVLYELSNSLSKSNVDPLLVDYVCKNLAQVLGNGVPMDVAFNLRRRTREPESTWLYQAIARAYVEELSKRPRESTKIIGELALKYDLADGTIKWIVSTQRKKYPEFFQKLSKKQ